MRRPLFGNGIPRNILVADGEVTVLDTEDLDPNQVYALTLYLWIFQAGPGPFTNPNLVTAVRTNGGGPVPVAIARAAWLDSFFSAPNPTRIEPIKLLDKLMVRGKQQVTIRAATDGAPFASAFVWGYFEQAGEQIVETPFRGLQPSKLTAPFNYPPVFLTFGPAAGGIAPVHRLDVAYNDLVTLDVANEGDGDVSFDFGASVIMPGSPPFAIPMPSLKLLAPGPGAFRHRVFDGIPMRAIDQTDLGSLIQVAAGSGAGTVISQVTGYGSFVRLS